MTPRHRITITPTQLHLEVTVDGVKVAESDRAVLLDETGLPTRYYLPRDDVRTELLRPSSRRTTCPFKGEAITGLMCFYNECVELAVGDDESFRISP